MRIQRALRIARIAACVLSLGTCSSGQSPQRPSYSAPMAAPDSPQEKPYSDAAIRYCGRAIFPEELWKLPGSVTLEAVVGTDGNVMRVSVIRSSHVELSQYAISTVQRWHFQPASKNGQSVESKITTTINFHTPKTRPTRPVSSGGMFVASGRQVPVTEAMPVTKEMLAPRAAKAEVK
jgi:TonB family protein